jgi:type I restriction enzyme R subunit
MLIPTESVKDEITKKIVYEGRAAKVLLNISKLKEIEEYYEKCEEEGANNYSGTNVAIPI